MASVDDLFKGVRSHSSKHPNGSKRAFDGRSEPSQTLKSLKRTANADVKSDRRARVSEATGDDESEEVDEDTMAGPMPPATDDGDVQDDEDEDEDEEGRFFGGGVNRKTAAALDYVDDILDSTPGTAAAIGAEEKFGQSWVRKVAVELERKITRNAELRAKYEDEPAKFMKSEADLDEQIKSLSILTEHPDLYPDFAEIGSVGSLVGLLAHENGDVAIDAIEIIAELTDEDVAASAEQWETLVKALLEADLLNILVQNLDRLKEGESEADRAGVYHSLALLENLASQTWVAEEAGKKAKLMNWLLDRVRRRERQTSQNKQYAAEVLAILIQSSILNRRVAIKDYDAVDVFLQLLSAYRKRDPDRSGLEEEYMENLFDSLTCLLDDTDGKRKFLEAEGVELALLMLREGKMSRPRALRLLDHALAAEGLSDSSDPSSSPSSSRHSDVVTEISDRIVEAAGLSVIFGIFMHPERKSAALPQQQQQAKTQDQLQMQSDHRLDEHMLGIFTALLRYLPGNSPSRIRALAKFVEKDYEKVIRLVRLRWHYSSRVAAVEREMRDADGDETGAEGREAERLFRRLDAGLFCLQSIDIVLAWLVAEDDGAKKTIAKYLAERDEGLVDLRATLEEQIQSLSAQAEQGDGAELDGRQGEQGVDDGAREMLVTLASFLQ